MDDREGQHYNLRSKRVVVTGGASFIGSHLVEKLLKQYDCEVMVLDNFSSGKFDNIKDLKGRRIEIWQMELLGDRDWLDKHLRGTDVVFHLAADHGGRGYVDTHQLACARNLELDGYVFRTAEAQGVERLVYASSGCVYPNHLQTDPDKTLYLMEGMVGPPYDADNMYGWAKLMAEMTLRHYARETDMGTASARYFTVYGPRGKEDHALIAMIARAFIKQDPFEIWGDGNQVRNWTYVDDIVEGTIRLAEEIGDGTAVNLGTDQRTTVLEAAHFICDELDHKPTFKFLPEMPTGPVNRVADNELAFYELDWTPNYTLTAGLRKTIEWYVATHDVDDVRANLEERLLER